MTHEAWFEGALSAVVCGGVGALMVISGVPFGVALTFASAAFVLCGLLPTPARRRGRG